MTHVQIDDAMFDHPKMLRVSKDAKILAIAAICYCGNQLTDGFIPAGAIAVLGARTGVTKTRQAIAELIEVRLWEVAEGGYRAHDDISQRRAQRPPDSEWRAIRSIVFQRDDFTCQYCGTRGGPLECDHVVPVSRGGASDLDNLATACRHCNRSKMTKLVEEWL